MPRKATQQFLERRRRECLEAVLRAPTASAKKAYQDTARHYDRVLARFRDARLADRSG